MRAGDGARRWSALLVVVLLVPAGVLAEELGGTAGEARKAAARARANGKTKEAVEHLLVGLGEHPHSPTLLLELIETSKDDSSARALWSHALVAALADEKGRFKLPKGSESLLDKKDESLTAVAVARAHAVSGLARSAKRAKGPGGYVLALAYLDLARALTADAPKLWKAYAATFEKALAEARPQVKSVVAALRKSAGSLEGPDPAGARLELGRALRGMAAQARAKAAGAPAGAGGSLDSLADGIIREALSGLAAEQMKPLTIDQLRAMDKKAIAAFNSKHSNIRRPGLALSESGRYRILTTCGHGTLLATAEIADPTHNRLARWFGADPFSKKNARGEIRVFPTFADLESESTPYYWANGFQRGAVTVVRFAAERKIDLARLLSHELMHRFDQVLFPGLAAWLKEGRGVWAGGAFGSLHGGDFVENYLDAERVNDAGPGLYGNRYWLEKFMKGDWDDYRDNYTAGHALWVYLYTWEENGKKLFRPRLKGYLEEAGTGTKAPIALFTSHFADGKHGRPKSMQSFAMGFGLFLRGWRQEREPAWFKSYVFRVGDDARSPYVEDVPTWNLERHREEPVFGQDHPARAAAVLAESGQVRAAIGLLEWSLSVDDFETGRARLLADLLEKDGRTEAAAALSNRIGGSRTPFVPGDHAVNDLAKSLDEAAADYADRGLGYAAHVLRSRERTLRDRLGGPEAPEGAKAAAPTNDHYPLCGPRLHHADEQWVEEKLSGGYDKFRDKEAWRVTPEGDLIVGKVSTETGGSAVAGSPWTFVRSDRPLRGAYTLSGRIALLSPHCQGAIVLGWTRRDRNVRLQFDAGAWGQEDRALAQDEALLSVGWHVTGLRYRDRALYRAETFSSVRLEKTRNEFAYRIDVDGDVLDFFVDGRRIATFAEGAGWPIAGFTGFAVRHGAIRVERPRVRFHRAGAHASCPHGFPFGHDPAAPKRDIDTWIVGRRILGAPRSEHGTLLIWYPLPIVSEDADGLEDVVVDARMQMNSAEGACRRLGCAPSFVVYLPRRWPEEARKQFAEVAKEVFGDKLSLRHHYEGLGAAANVDPDDYGYSPYFLFQDPNGVTRYVGRGSVDSDDPDFARWIRIYRGW